MTATSPFVTSRREELEETAAKYTDKPKECVAALRGHILDDIAEGLALIGIRGGLVDMLSYAAELANDEAADPTDDNDALKYPKAAPDA